LSDSLGILQQHTDFSDGPYDFPDPEPLELDQEERDRVAATIRHLYEHKLRQDATWRHQHQIYDRMYRGQLDTGRVGPWEGSSNLHIPLPYWAADAIHVRLTMSIWDQTPLVSGRAVEDADQEIFENARSVVTDHLSPQKMNARAGWSRVSKTRAIHGYGVGFVPWVKAEHRYRIEGPEEVELDYDDDGNPKGEKRSRKPAWKTATTYDGPIIVPMGWDDVLTPVDWSNLQPVTLSNPQGADFVLLRFWETLGLIWQKRDRSYTYIDLDDDLKDIDDWRQKSPAQNRSGEGHERTEVQDQMTQKNRGDAPQPEERQNPSFETLTAFLPWTLTAQVEDAEGKTQRRTEEVECVFFYRVDNYKLLGGFRLADVNWKYRRPLMELQFQTCDIGGESMGVMEIAQHLAAELDTMHNMRIDVGMATNMPFFFYQAASSVSPSQIILRPMEGVPVDDVNAVRFPTFQNVTSFYAMEEQLIYSLAERTLGVTDLFLGVSPTRGAASRTATGFIGTQQESMARTSEVVRNDTEEFGRLCHLIYNQELQYGPDYRVVRLLGKSGPMTQKLSLQQLWLRGEYDFYLGANEGMFSSHKRQERAQIIMQTMQMNPFLAQDIGRQWELWRDFYHTIGVPDPERFIGPKSALPQGSPKEQDEENQEMAQFAHGVGQPAPVHPSDNDQEHLRQLAEWLKSPSYAALQQPNRPAYFRHAALHQQALATKAQMAEQQRQAMMAAPNAPGGSMQPGGQGPGVPGGPALGQERIVPGLEGSGAMGEMGRLPEKPMMEGAMMGGGGRGPQRMNRG